MLAYSQGGASSPGGSTAAPAGNALGAAVSTAQQGRQTNAAVEMNQAQIELVKAQAARERSVTLDNNVATAAQATQLKILQEQLIEASHRAVKMGDEWRSFRDQYEADKAAGAFKGRAVEPASKGSVSALEAKRLTETFAADVARRKAKSLTAVYGNARAKAESDFWKSGLGDAAPYIKAILPLLSFGAGLAR